MRSNYDDRMSQQRACTCATHMWHFLMHGQNGRWSTSSIPTTSFTFNATRSSGAIPCLQRHFDKPVSSSACAPVMRETRSHQANMDSVPHCIIFAGTTKRGSAGPSPCVCRAAAMCQVVIVAAGLKGLRLSGRRDLPRPMGIYAMYPVIFTRPTPRIRRCECVMRRQWTRACRNLSRAARSRAACTS